MCRRHGAVHLEREVAAPAERVWEVLSDRRRTDSWLGRLEGEDPAPGAVFAVWHDETTRSTHRVTRWETGRVLGLTWVFPGERPTAVEFTLEPVVGGSGCLLTVDHEGLDDPVAYAAGWHRHLDHLSAAARGSDLPLAGFWDGYDELVAAYSRAGERECPRCTSAEGARST